MSNCLGPLQAAKDTKNQLAKYSGTRDGIIDSSMMLMKCHLENAHAKVTPLDKA